MGRSKRRIMTLAAARARWSRATADAVSRSCNSSNGRARRGRSRWWLRGRGRRWKEEESGHSQPEIPKPRGSPGAAVSAAAACSCSCSGDASGRRAAGRAARETGGGGVALLSARPRPPSVALPQAALPGPPRPAPVWQRLMAAVGPPRQQVRMAQQQVWAALEVALRVPCLYIIDAIFNSYYDSSQSGLCIGLQIFFRLLGIFASSIVLILSQRSLFKFYIYSSAFLLAATSVLVNYYASLHIDFYGAYNTSAFGIELLPRKGPSLWMALTVLQLTFGIGYITLLQIHSIYSQLIILDLLVPIIGLITELPLHIRETLVFISSLILTLNTILVLAVKLKWFYYSTRYVYLLVRHMYRIYGLQLLMEDTWKRIRFPDILRVFWLTRITAQATVLMYILRVANETDSFFISWDDFWDLICNLIISGCDSTLTVLGMSAVISSVAHYLGLGILAFIGSTEEDDKRLGFVAPVLFFILALQTGLSGLRPEERLIRLSRNMCLLLTAVLHFIHGMTDPVLMSLSASHVSSFRRHFPVLFVSACLFILPVLLSYVLWHHYALNTWLFAVTAFCVELCLKVIVSLTVYTLFMIDGYYNVLWEKLDDYVYYVRSTGNIIEFIFGVVMFGNGAYTMMFESGSKIRACMMCLHAYFNIYLQAKNGWKTFMNRRTAVKKINSLPEIKGSRLQEIDDVCAICYHEFTTAARITPCNHYFHALCLRKWLYIQDTCPMCHQKVYIEDDIKDNSNISNNNGFIAPNDPEEEDIQEDAAAEESDRELNEDDSTDYDDDIQRERNGVLQHTGAAAEEFINDDTD
ncbi:E3 ubiquitin-protein ligase RNF139 [Erinaceus europaeus]|uniref:E3 ubiquitin-protein ligase RNF139 n=1 Tax=Erinaceus europaeus TaxID=9365 RepID=A0A1S2ZKN0_ERIEU|nr:E3 ubiquitin-protein ligase RNF139 [Erinaceus europaeus]